MNEKNILKIGLNKIKKFLNDGRITTHTENLFFLIEDGLEKNGNQLSKIHGDKIDELFYVLCYEYEKGNVNKTFRAVDLLKEDYPGLYIDTSYYYLNVCHGDFDKGYLIDMCMEKGITPEIKLVSEKEVENGKIVCREIMTFNKENEKKLVKNRDNK